jgi:hypothetical protein
MIYPVIDNPGNCKNRAVINIIQARNISARGNPL